MVYKHAVVAAFGIYAQRGEDAAIGEVGGFALNSHGNYIVDHGKSWKNHGIVFLNFCWNPELCVILECLVLWQTVMIQMKCSIMQLFIRFFTIC